jgi:tRNA(Ile)-lysidine synthase
MRSSAQGSGRTLKNLFQEQGVPAWKRDVPLLFVGDTLLFVPLLGVNHAALTAPPSIGDVHAEAGERHVRIEWREDLTVA